MASWLDIGNAVGGFTDGWERGLNMRAKMRADEEAERQAKADAETRGVAANLYNKFAAENGWKPVEVPEPYDARSLGRRMTDGLGITERDGPSLGRMALNSLGVTEPEQAKVSPAVTTPLTATPSAGAPPAATPSVATPPAAVVRAPDVRGVTGLVTPTGGMGVPGIAPVGGSMSGAATGAAAPVIVARPAAEVAVAPPRATSVPEARGVPEGLSTGFTNAVVRYESGGDPNAKNPRSSATGVGQFIKGTWLDLLRRNRPDIAQGKSDAELLQLRTDPALSREMIQVYRHENAGELRAAGLPVSDATLALAHGFGSAGARSILTAAPGTSMAQVFPPSERDRQRGYTESDVIRSNPRLRNMTAGQVIEQAQQRFGGGAPASGTTSGTTSGSARGGLPAAIQPAAATAGSAAPSPTAAAAAQPAPAQSVAAAQPTAPALTTDDEIFSRRGDAVLDRFTKDYLPQMALRYAAVGDVAKFQAIYNLAQTAEVKRATKNWGRMYAAAQSGNAEQFGKAALAYYSDYPDGYSISNSEPVKDSAGKTTGFRFTVRNEATGKEARREMSLEQVQQLAFANHPEKLIDVMIEQRKAATTAASEIGKEARANAEWERRQGITQQYETAKEDRAAGRDEAKYQRDQAGRIELEREKAALKGEGPGKLPAALQKDEAEDLAVVQGAVGINQDLGRVREQIATGKLSLGPMANRVSEARNSMGASSENSRNYASFMATLERLRNESLRLNKGVQTEGDSQRAWNELITHIADPKLVQQRIEEIQQINARAAEFRRNLIQSRRRDNRVEPLDIGRVVPAGSGAAPASSPAAPPPAAATPTRAEIDAELARRGVR